jgi:CelD/BcsL family acetyltransferase involved in cellulose biosynthesis
VLETELIDDPAALEALAPAWDALAVANRQPLAAPAWMLGIWRHLPPQNGLLRAVVVRDGDELVGIAPCFANCGRRARVDYSLLSGAMPRVSPLAVPGREWEVAEALAGALAQADPLPDVIALESAPLASHWPLALREGWPGRVRPTARQYFVQPSLTTVLSGDSFDDWLATKSSNFRGQIRRARRQFEAAGGSVRLSTPATLRDDLAAFMRLHASRWDGLGESAIVARAEGWAALYEQIGREQLDGGRLRLVLLEIDGEPISAQTFAAAGGEAIHLNGGWDERHAKLKPSLLGILAGLEDALVRGDERLDLGPGDQPYKARIADGNDPVAWTMLVVPRPRMALTLARVAPTLARIAVRDAAKRALSDEQTDRLRELRGRLRRSA